MIENLNTTYILIGVCAVLALLFVMYIWKSNRNTTPQVGSDSDSHNDNERIMTVGQMKICDTLSLLALKKKFAKGGFVECQMKLIRQTI